MRANRKFGFWTWIWSMRHWTGTRNGLLISMLQKIIWFCLTGLITLVLLKWKMLEKRSLFLWKNHLLKCWGWLSLLNWIGTLKLSQWLKLPLRKLEPWFVLWSFFLLRLLCISINLPYGHVWNIVVISGLVPTWKSTTWYFTWFLLGIKLGTPDELHKRIYRTVGSSFAASLEPFAHCGNVAS